MEKKTKVKIVIHAIIALFFAFLMSCMILTYDYGSAALFLWFIAIALINILIKLYKYFDSLTSPFKQLKNFVKDNPRVLPLDLKKVLKAEQSMKLHKEQHKKIDKNSTQGKAYEKIYAALYTHADVVMASLNTIDYVYFPDGNDRALSVTIHKEAEIIDELAHKLNELDSIFLSIDSSGNENECLAADELIQSLKEML